MAEVLAALLAAMLHLCNIEMANDPESEEVIVMNEDELYYGMYYIPSPHPTTSCSLTSSARTWILYMLF